MAFKKVEALEEKGYIELKPFDGDLDPAEWETLEYVDWKSGGDTNFAILASANGEHDPRGFWEYGKPDKGGIWVEDNIEKSPTFKKWTESVGANFGRVRVIKLNKSAAYEDAVRNIHKDDNNRLTEDGTGWVVRAWLQLTDDPDSYMILRENKDDVDSEVHLHLPKGAVILVDSERLDHAVFHPGDKPRYAVIASFESGPELESWIEANQQ